MITRKTNQLLDIAINELGVAEGAGKDNNNPRILEYHSVTTLNATTDEVPWCSSFVNWVVLKSGHEPTRSAMAASWRTWGHKLKRPIKGCIIGYIKDDGSGHVGFYVGGSEGYYRILGGNQHDAVSVSNYKIGDRDWFFVEPKVFINSKTARAGGAIASVAATQGGEDIIKIVKGVRKDTTELKTDVSEIGKSVATGHFTPYVNTMMPYVVLILAVYVIYDRLSKESRKDV